MVLPSKGTAAIVPPPATVEEERFQAQRQRRSLAIWVRLGLIASAVAVLAVFGVAIWLDPTQDNRVWLQETHTQLGLPPCTFKRLTNLPCPSCGMTTSFAWLMRGNLWNSMRANFVGTLLALGCLLFVPWGLASAIEGRIIGARFWERWLIRFVLAFLILLFLRWGIVIALTV